MSPIDLGPLSHSEVHWRRSRDRVWGNWLEFLAWYLLPGWFLRPYSLRLIRLNQAKHLWSVNSVRNRNCCPVGIERTWYVESIPFQSQRNKQSEERCWCPGMKHYQYSYIEYWDKVTMCMCREEEGERRWYSAPPRLLCLYNPPLSAASRFLCLTLWYLQRYINFLSRREHRFQSQFKIPKVHSNLWTIKETFHSEQVLQGRSI